MRDDAVAFLKSFYASDVWRTLTWRGVHALKCPFDLWIYQEIVHRVRPRTIVEVGVWNGGTALFLADMLDLADRASDARVVAIDIEAKPRPSHPRIEYVVGDSADPATFARARALIRPGGATMVILDSDHTKAHVLKELALYPALVTVGSYLVVEDTCVNGNPLLPGWGEGPTEALREFLPAHPEFRVDEECERMQVTLNPGGYLKRIA